MTGSAASAHLRSDQSEDRVVRTLLPPRGAYAARPDC